MKERPILFTPENAQKVFEGTKTQTRRLNKLAKVNEAPNDWVWVLTFKVAKLGEVPR